MTVVFKDLRGGIVIYTDVLSIVDDETHRYRVKRVSEDCTTLIYKEDMVSISI